MDLTLLVRRCVKSFRDFNWKQPLRGASCSAKKKELRMTQDQFHALFQKIFSEIPDYAYASISQYISNREIQINVLLSDDAVDNAESSKGAKYPIAIFLPDATVWHFAFRTKLAEAPSAVTETIVRHEFVHAFQIVETTAPTEAGQTALAIYREKLAALPPEAVIDADEGLTQVINMGWGSDEEAAASWLQSIES